MTSTLTSPSPVARRTASRDTSVPQRRRPTGIQRQRTSRDQRVLGRYTDEQGHAREVIARGAAAGSTLVVDRDHATHGDPRLVAHLAADEPCENAALICERYLEHPVATRRRCRLLTAEDARIAPFAESADGSVDPPRYEAQPVDRRGCLYRLELVRSGMSIPELRWRRHPPQAGGEGEGEVVSAREAVAALQSYEPVCALTLGGLSRHAGGEEVSTAVLRLELARVRESPIVLNRRLREVVLATVTRHELSMSEIALRCGRVKRDRRGNESGETSWLARRLGLLPEGGHSDPTPWIHSDVLALIARRGLGVSPREVEL
jgi:hypothetical protein